MVKVPFKRESLRQIAIKLCLYYLLFAPIVFTPFYNTVIFHPYKAGEFQAPSVRGVPIQNLTFTGSGGTRLHAWYLHAPNSRYTALISHGNAGNLTHRSGLIDLLLEAGCSVFIYDYAGYGLSSGAPGLKSILDDGAQAYAYLVDTMHVPAADIIIVGESIGGAVACNLAAKRQCAGLMLQSPFSSLQGLARLRIPIFYAYPDFLFPQDALALDNVAAVRGLRLPILIVHGEKDTLVPFSESQALARANPGIKLTALPNSGHNDIYFVDRPAYLAAVKSYIRDIDED
jgi:uncharacterized protein